MKCGVCLIAAVVVFPMVMSAPAVPDLPRTGDLSSLVLKYRRNRIQPKELHEECDDCQPKPTSQDLNTQHLTTLLGGRLDASVSLIKPKESPSPPHSKVSLNTASKAKRRLLRELIRNGTKNMAEFSGTLSRDVERFMVGWLLQQGSCPLVHTWRDMGPHFWPRYVKRANCVNKQCSLNPSSTCEPSANRYFPLLRWHCVDANTALLLPLWGRHRAVKRSEYWCNWVRFSYPITTQCSCACSRSIVGQ